MARAENLVTQSQHSSWIGITMEFSELQFSPIIRPVRRKIFTSRSFEHSSLPAGAKVRCLENKSLTIDGENDSDDSQKTYFSQAELFLAPENVSLDLLTNQNENCTQGDMINLQAEFADVGSNSALQGNDSSPRKIKKKGKESIILKRLCMQKVTSPDYNSSQKSISFHDVLLELERDVSFLEEEVQNLDSCNLAKMLDAEAKITGIVTKSEALEASVSRTEKKRITRIFCACQDLKQKLRQSIRQPQDGTASEIETQLSVQEDHLQDKDLPDLKTLMELRLIRPGRSVLILRVTNLQRIYGSLNKDGMIVEASSKMYSDTEEWCKYHLKDPDVTRFKAFSKVYFKSMTLLSICRKYSPASNVSKEIQQSQVPAKEKQLKETRGRKKKAKSQIESELGIAPPAIESGTYDLESELLSLTVSNNLFQDLVLPMETIEATQDLIEPSLPEMDLGSELQLESFNNEFNALEMHIAGDNPCHARSTGLDLTSWRQDKAMEKWDQELKNVKFRETINFSLMD